MENLIKFFNSSFLTSFITFIVGGLAIWLYWKQRIDRKRDAASLILQEIRYAEEQIRKYKDFKRYSLSDRLLPTNNWNNNIHFFIKDLKETDIDLINAFYAKASYIDIEIRTISNWKNRPKEIIIKKSNSTQLDPSATAVNQDQNQDQLITFDPMEGTQKILFEISMSIEFLYNTPAVEKLRKISEGK